MSFAVDKLGREAAVTPRGADTRERILEAAKQLMAERGYAGASVGAICERAGVARTALYWHFGSKAGLLVAVTQHVFGAWNDQIRESVYATGDPLQRLERLIEGQREMVLGDPSVPQVLFGIALEGESIPPAIGDQIRAHRDAVHQMIIDGFQDSIGGPLPDLDVVARLVVAFNHDAVLMHRLDPGGPDVDRIFDELRRAIVLIVGHRLGERLGGNPRAPTGESP